MTSIGFLILFHLVSCVLLPCEGQVQPPSNGTKLTIFPGSTVKIDWSYVGTISQVQLRTWFFRSSDDGSPSVQFAAIAFDLAPVQKNFSIIPRFDIERPAALVLRNVDKTYDGIYTFGLTTQSSNIPQTSEVVVYIAAKPTVTISCPSSVTLNEGDDFTCTCRGKGGNPPANVTWYKVGEQIGVTGTENRILTLTNVNETHNGTYTCLAQSYTTEAFEKRKAIVVLVNFKPKDTSIGFTQNPVELGKPVTIKCQSRGFSEPSYTIILNGTKTVSSERMYTISKAGWNDTGTYNCTATNERGSDWAADVLNVREQGPTKTQPATPTTKTSNKTTTRKGANTPANKEDDDGTTVVVWHIVVSLLSGIIFGIFLSHTIWWSRRCWFRNRKPERHPKQEKTEADTTYQELDLSKMNAEDNYQSLRVNTAIEDVENNYQSLT